MEHNNEFIALDVNETLYFEHGQEIAEMLSISLDPDITLETYEAYAKIQGILVLNGSYRKLWDEIKKESDDHHGTSRYIEKIVDKPENEADFYHRFPMDITIPKERIKQIEDINVEITAFDYEIPDHHKLKVNATLHITGLAQDTENEHWTRNHEPTKQQEKEEEEKHQEVEAKDEVEEAVIVEDTSESTEPPASTDKELTEASEEDEVVEEEHKEVAYQEIIDESTIDISLNKTEEEEEIEESSNFQFLTGLFGGTEEEMQATVTLYIIQEEDTVEAIAKRFELPTLQLIKDNDLSGEQLESGQLLYIMKN